MADPVRIPAVSTVTPTFPKTVLDLPDFATDSAMTAAVPDRPFRSANAHAAYEEAGLGPEDLSLAEVYDLSTALELDWYEDIGLCGQGGAEELLQAIRVVATGDSLLFPSAVRSLLAAHRVARQVPGIARLTSREGEVLRLMARGRSNAEIARELVVGLETVKTHVGNVLAKLGARDRTQAVVAAYESGFVSGNG